MTKRKTLVVTALSMLALLPAIPVGGQEQGQPDLRPVLLVIDLQNIWLPRMAESDRESAPAKINEAIARFREWGYPIIAVYHSDPTRGPETGTEPFEFADWVAVSADDPVVVKAEPSAFTGTDLDGLLKQTDRNVVCLCGLSATGCVLATYFGAIDRGYMAFMVEDALLSGDAAHTDVIEDICYTMSIEELAKALEGQH